MKNLKLHIEIAKMQNLERGCLLYCRLGMENQVLRQLKIFVCLPPTSVSGCTGITNTVLPVLLIPIIVTEKVTSSPEQKQAVIEALQKSPHECGFNKSNWTMLLAVSVVKFNYPVLGKKIPTCLETLLVD